jgi:hypothetical protein
MSQGYSGVKAHDDVVNAADLVRQNAVAAATGATAQATIRSAEITYYRAVALSAIKNNVSPAAAMQALHELGVQGQ